MTANEPTQYASIFDALADTPAEAENLRVRSMLMVAIRDRIDEFGWSQRVAAQNLGVTQPRVSELKNGKLGRFSIDVLVNLASQVGLTVEVNIVPTAKPARVGEDSGAAVPCARN